MKPNSLNRPDLNAETLKAVAQKASNSIAKSAQREVPTVYRCALKTEWFRKFSLWERVQILFGCNLVVMTGIATQHNPGKFHPLIMGRVSYQETATSHMEHVVANMLEEQAPKSPVVHEEKGEA